MEWAGPSNNPNTLQEFGPSHENKTTGKRIQLNTDPSGNHGLGHGRVSGIDSIERDTKTTVIPTIEFPNQCHSVDCVIIH